MFIGFLKISHKIDKKCHKNHNMTLKNQMGALVGRKGNYF
jgi:hypothetical protein